jgi:hypothetical protein
MGKSLRLRWLWNHKKNQINEGCIQSICRIEDAATSLFFLASICCMVGNGASTLFWADPWLDGQTIASTAPDLVAAVSMRCQRSRTVQAALQGKASIRDISGALTVPAIVQYLHLRERVEHVQLQPVVLDSISLRWSASGDFSSKSAYAALNMGQANLLGAKQVWRAKAPREFKFFIWLLLHDQCWTLDRRERHGLENLGPCAFCNQNPVVIDHFQLFCIFSEVVWLLVLQRFGWQNLVPVQEERLVTWWLRT